MTTSADVIAALNQRRQRKSLRPEVPGALPDAWQRWLDAAPMEAPDAVRAAAPDWIRAFAARPPRPIPRSPGEMGRWQSFATLLQQNWTADPREERRLRIGVGVVDTLLHLVLVAMLLWLMYLRFLALAQAPPDEEAVQVEFIGRGNVADGGGALANAGAQSAPAAAAPAPAAPSPTPAPATGRPDAQVSVEAVPPPPSLAVEDTPQRMPAPSPPVEAPQPLQVTEVPVPAPQSFQLPPPKVRPPVPPQPVLREVPLKAQVESLPTVEPPKVRVLQPRERQAALQVPELREQPQALDVPAPQRMPTLPARSAPTPARTAQVAVPDLRGQVREIPMPAGGAPAPSAAPGDGTAAAAQANANGAGGERGSAPTAGQAPAGSGQGVAPSTQGGRGVAASGSGAGPVLKPAPGGWPGAAKSDDWGASKRNVAGTGNGRGKDGKGDGKGPGLFNDDGSVRLPDEWSQQTGLDIDRAGTWLKRPGLEYRGTRFDRYWIPQGNLLEEWVRRGIKQIAIPIPGTNTRLECVVSLLQLGGGCFPVNPDANEQPATARPPPDIPFKPELQEDNGSVRPGG